MLCLADKEPLGLKVRDAAKVLSFADSPNWRLCYSSSVLRLFERNHVERGRESLGDALG
jgi:hypothetical protein